MKPKTCDGCTRWSNFFHGCTFFADSLEDMYICPCQDCLVKPMCKTGIICPVFRKRVDEYFGLQKGLKYPEEK